MPVLDAVRRAVRLRRCVLKAEEVLGGEEVVASPPPVCVHCVW